MRRTRIAAATVMVAAGLIGAVAAPATTGKTRHLVGAVEEQLGSSVSMTVKLNNKNRPKFVKSFTLSGLSMLCGDPLTSRKFDLEVPGRMPVGDLGDYDKTVEDFDGDGSDLLVSGTVLKKGKSSVGKIETLIGSSCHGLDYFLARKE